MLFTKENVKLSSGRFSRFKIECDALTDSDWECLAYLASKQVKFKSVVSVPTGGDTFAKYLSEYVTDDETLPTLICDDVLTSGGSMERKKTELNIDNVIGIVAFSRGTCPDWITTLFDGSLNENS